MKGSVRRVETRQVEIGSVKIGGENKIAVQSMTNTDTENVEETVQQIKRLERVGCELVRVAVPDMNAALNLSEIKKKINIPLIADIHYNYKLALEAGKQGVDKIRINPGNIGERERVLEIMEMCADRNIALRVGGNTGSIEEKYLEKYGGPTAEALVESVIDELKIIEDRGFSNVVVSLKSSNVPVMIEANRIFSEKRDYPLHIGVTEAGPPGTGEIYSAVGIGTLLSMGIGDTVRVSLTGDPEREIEVAYKILSALNIRRRGPRIISCPTCGRLEYDLNKFVEIIEERTKNVRKPLTIAVMGCSVNGPGEAKEADIGIAGGKKTAVIFRKGEIVAKVPEKDILERFFKELKSITGEDINGYES